MQHNQSLPPHLRNDYSMSMRHNSMLGSTSTTHFTSASQPRLNITSNPSSYAPPQPLEPPTAGSGSGGASPHTSGINWGSPSHGTLPSPTGLDFGAYPDPTYGGQHMFFPSNGNGMRRPQSTEPEDWSLRSTGRSSSNFNHHLNMAHDWSAVALSELKQERAFAM